MILVWEKTGDSLEIVVDNHQLVEYWLNALSGTNKNSFDFIQSSRSINSKIDMLVDCLESSNQILSKFKIDPLMNSSVDWLDQNNLNILHEKWVKLQHKYKIVEVLSRLPDRSFEKKFHDVNHLIHQIESRVRIDYINDLKNTWQVDNIFGPNIAKFGQWQIELHYQNLGRSNYEKWNNYDNNIIDSDTNNFTHIGGLVYFNLCRPHNSQPPLEYVKYCRDNNLTPYGNKLPIGNFKVDITTLRHTFQRNVSIENNRLSFKI